MLIHTCIIIPSKSFSLWKYVRASQSVMRIMKTVVIIIAICSMEAIIIEIKGKPMSAAVTVLYDAHTQGIIIACVFG